MGVLGDYEKDHGDQCAMLLLCASIMRMESVCRMRPSVVLVLGRVRARAILVPFGFACSLGPKEHTSD